jgi:hypothetical protein
MRLSRLDRRTRAHESSRKPGCFQPRFLDWIDFDSRRNDDLNFLANQVPFCPVEMALRTAAPQLWFAS